MIREMCEQDIDSVVELDKVLFHSPWNKEQFLYELNENTFASLYVMEEQGDIVGYIDYWITFEIAQLAKIAISRNNQHNGYGRTLMSEMIKRCEEAMCETISLEVRVHNKQAIALYKHYDFIEVTLRKGYYQDGEDASLMVKALGGSYV